MKTIPGRTSPARLVVALVLLSTALSVRAQDLSASFGFGAQQQKRARVAEITFDRETYAAGDTVRGSAVIEIDETWHINSVSPTSDFAIPTELHIESPALEAVNVRFPPHLERPFEFAGGETLAVYEGELTVIFEARHSGASDEAVTATLRFQACDDSVCLPPADDLFQTSIGENSGSVPAEPAAAAGEHGTAASEGFTPLSAGEGASSRPSLFSGDVGGTIAAYGLPVALAVVLLLGLALNLTPCVYPLIPITLGFFTAQTGNRRAARAGLAVTYVLGIAVTYSALGVLSALSGSLFGAWLQSPAVLVGFALLMLVLASSMFGLWEIRVPHFITDRAGGRSGFAGAATMGLLAGIVAAPCVGPVVISLIAFVSERQDPVLGFSLFFTLAIGLGLPYLILGIFSSGLSQIPRSGPWMVIIKQALGFVLVAMAFYFLRPLTGDQVFRWGAAISLLLGALILLVRGASAQARVVRWAAAVLLLAGGLFFVFDVPPSEGVEWEPYDEARLAQAQNDGTPVVIDFYADWCLPCKELDRNTFTDPAVIDESERFVRLKADLTRTSDSDTKALTERYEIVGVPTIVFLEPSGEEQRGARLTGYEGPEKFLERMRRVRASVASR